MSADPRDSLATDGSVDHLGLIAEMSRDFAESQDIDTTLKRGLERIAVSLDAEAASLFLLENEDSELVCRACYGPVDITGLRLAPDSGVLGRTVQQQAAQMVRDTSKDPDFGGLVDKETGFTTRSILCAPLSVRDTCIGAIELINKQGEALFDDRDRRLLEALAASAALAIINARLAAAMVERERLRRELELAATIQRSFLPKPHDAEFPIHGANVPAREVSGDFYDIVERTDGRIWFNVADVAGKGVNAALLMAKTTSLFRHLAKTAQDPVAVAVAINAELYETAAYGMFVTMACGVYDPASGLVQLANAGHEPAIVCRRAGGVEQQVPAQTPPLGILPELAPDPPPAPVEIDLTGRRLYLFTDGLTEALGPDGAPLGADGVVQRIAQAEADGLEPPRRIAQVIRAIAPKDEAPADDLTLLVVEGPRRGSSA